MLLSYVLTGFAPLNITLTMHTQVTVRYIRLSSVGEAIMCMVDYTSFWYKLITYVESSFEVAVIKEINYSTMWERLFLELKHGSLNNKFIIGDVYKPPRDNNNNNNNANNIDACTREIVPILQELSSSNTKVLICGDYNINLLKLAGESHLAVFLTWCWGIVFIQKLLYPNG